MLLWQYFELNGSYTLGQDLASCSSLPEGGMLKYTIQIDFLVINNTVEYEGLVIGLQLAK
jgi:hypothetical protein